MFLPTSLGAAALRPVIGHGCSSTLSVSVAKVVLQPLNSIRKHGAAPKATPYAMDINLAVTEKFDKASLSEVAQAHVSALRGIGPKSSEALFEALGVETVSDLASNKYVRLARALVTMADMSVGHRQEGSALNIDKAVMAAYEADTLPSIVNAPVAALQGLTEERGAHLGVLGVHKVRDLGELKYAAWAEAIVTLAAYEAAQR